MTKYILAIIAACFLAAPALAQHRHPGPRPNHVNPGPHLHQNRPYYRHPHYDRRGPAYNCGHFHRGCTYRHWCFQYNWRGYTSCVWYPRYGCYLYWCPVNLCWYRYVEVDLIFVPCDDLCDPNLR
jgi:hypothetical protein